jgi:MarR family transcriptional regulator, transcriptional regulator for hemolysin
MEKLNDLLFYHLDKAIKTYRHFAQNQLKKSGFDVTIDQWLVLKMIYDHPGINQLAIAEGVFKDSASVTRIIDLLVRKKYVERSSHPSDRRKFKLSISKTTTKILQQINKISLRNRIVALRGLNPKDIQKAKNIMITITENCRNSGSSWEK